MKPLLTALALLTALTGCVSQGTYDALRTEHETTQGLLEERNLALKKREEELAAGQKREQDLQAALASEKDNVKELNERIYALEAERARVLKDRSAMEASVAEMTTALNELQQRKEEAEARMGEYRALLAKFRGLIDAGKLKVRIVEGRMVVVLASDVLFPSGSASLSKEGKAAVGEVATLLASIPRRQFQVEGHTDNVPIATAQYPSNWELAAARALTVVKTMREVGMPPDRISAASFGDSKPAVPNDSAEGRAQNRRIEITIVPDLSTLPGFDELQRVEKES
ncbi:MULTISPECIES: OmpA family protein [Myxococcaceae]|uniref:OmpA/MotB family protein n=1 Tax=Myxococcaceae TaxID=31 RepID=UPI001E46F0B4|nr:MULTISPECIES: OmpA family protein [Myxococcaceae]